MIWAEDSKRSQIKKMKINGSEWVNSVIKK